MIKFLKKKKNTIIATLILVSKATGLLLWVVAFYNLFVAERTKDKEVKQAEYIWTSVMADMMSVQDWCYLGLLLLLLFMVLKTV